MPAVVPPTAASSGVRHVAILLLAPFVSGAEHQTLALCRYLRARCRVTLLTNDEFADALAADPFLRRYSDGLAVQRLGRAFPAAPAATPSGLLKRSLYYLRLQIAAWRVLRRLGPCVVHLVLAPSFFAYAPLFHLLPLPTVLTLSGEMRYVRHFYGLAKRTAVGHAVSRATALVVCSVDEMANLHQVAPQHSARAVVLDNFTDVERFSAAPKELLVTFAARLHPEKGAFLFLDAAAQAHRMYPRARFALMGRGELELAVRRRIDALSLHGVLQTGFTTDLAPLFARSTIFVSCQLYENLGSSSLLEAMASENAVVATDVGQTWRIVDGTVGLRVRPNALALAEAIGALLSDLERTRTLGRAARRRVLEHYSPNPYVERLMDIYACARDGTMTSTG